MKRLAILIFLMAFTLSAYSQGSFTEKTFHDLMEKSGDQMFILENTDENFVFITGNGQKMGRTELKELTSTMAVINEFSDLTVNQSGGTAIVSGLIDQKISQKANPSDVFKYKGVFTAVYAKQKKNWVLMSWQHSDYKPNN
ncbi:nuclear transport factor 2 family protein [Cognataquiflexum rubidum]|uniref:nuclear transport factor 2 family protein n=1 Tax=Cognataquiflexum rubidum TaxID=2922273 RepID=UPI001F141F17|nr:nuclear transport factor 2 family protein [Cognataquiflexum rubidum]MCH6235839.1 nuclear transport factor 2 family protein [Cognataquiflexum rubidum]